MVKLIHIAVFYSISLNEIRMIEHFLCGKHYCWIGTMWGHLKFVKITVDPNTRSEISSPSRSGDVRRLAGHGMKTRANLTCTYTCIATISISPTEVSLLLDLGCSKFLKNKLLRWSDYHGVNRKAPNGRCRTLSGMFMLNVNNPR